MDSRGLAEFSQWLFDTSKFLGYEGVDSIMSSVTQAVRSVGRVKKAMRIDDPMSVQQYMAEGYVGPVMSSVVFALLVARRDGELSFEQLREVSQILRSLHVAA